MLRKRDSCWRLGRKRAFLEEVSFQQMIRAAQSPSCSRIGWRMRCMRCGVHSDVLLYRPKQQRALPAARQKGPFLGLSHRALVLVKSHRLLFDESPVL
jgi:hypothetical protein